MSGNISGDDIFAEVERIAAMGNRRTGSEIEREAMEYVLHRFAEIGLKDTAIEEFDINYWNPVRTELEILAPGHSQNHSTDEPLKCKPLWYTGPTPPEGITGECEYCGYGLPHQFGSAKDKIAVIDSRILLHFWPTYRFFESYKYALSSGAKALVIIIDAPGDLIPIFTADEAEHNNPMPAALVSRSGGAILKERMASRKTDLRFILEAERKTGRTADVVGVLPGRTDEHLIVGAHHDSIYEGAIDNAGGMAALLAIAGELARRPEPPEKTIIFATHPGHELLIGTREFIKNQAGILESTAAYITLDGIGCDNYEEIDGRIQKTGRDEPRGLFLSPNPRLAEIVFPAVKKYNLQPAAFLSAEMMCPNPDLEGRFLEAGVPIINVIGKPIWYHTEEDTPDKCTPDQLLRGTLAHLEIIEALDLRPAAEIREAERKLSDPTTLVEKAAPEAFPGASPRVDFTYLPETPKTGEPALIYVSYFDDAEGILVDMSWDIGGEAGSKGPVLLHVFGLPGEHAVSLTVTNDLGAKGRCEKIIGVE